MRTITMMVLMLAVGVAGGQQGDTKPEGTKQSMNGTYGGPAKTKVETPAPKKSALEDALDLALKNNPDLRVAASKLALAEAELSRTRLQITQKVAGAYADVLTERAAVSLGEKQVMRSRQAFEAGSLEPVSFYKVQQELSERKAKLAASERELEHLQGKGGPTEQQSLAAKAEFYRRTGHPATAAFYDGLVRRTLGEEALPTLGRLDLTRTPKTEGSDKLRQALRKKVTLSVEVQVLSAYLALIKKTAGISIQADAKDPAWKGTIQYDFEDVTVGGMLQFLEDSLPGHRIVVREYGLLVVAKDKVPPGAVTLAAFLHAEPANEKVRPPIPAGQLDGKVTKVDGKLCTVSIGRSVGLSKGDRLYLYRLAPTPKYLGILEVAEVTDDAAVCKTAARMAGNVAVGDMVTTRINGAVEVPISPPAR